MVESILVMVMILLVFIALFNLSDRIRAKLLVENAAVKCARARAVGYNDFMLRKIARLATMPAAGRCLSPVDSGDKSLSLADRYVRMGDYLMSEYEAQADAVLDFEYWRNGDTQIKAASGGSPATAAVVQYRPDDFNIRSFALEGGVGKDANKVPVSAEATVEAHYPDYLQ
jgi:hypothetical protein